jgi:energy-converting hydrogenase Eha subunit G
VRVKKIVKIMFLFNWNGEHIASYLIHLNKNKTKRKSKTTQNWSKLNGISTIYVLLFVKSFTICYIKCVCPRIWVRKVYV